MANFEPSSVNVDAAEIDRFAALAQEWWDESGPMKPLHRMNAVRMAFARQRLCPHFGLDCTARRPFEGLRILDLGCGAGLMSEPLAALGASVVAIDAAAENVDVAQLHAAARGLAVDYRHATAEDLRAGAEVFDAVVAMELLEHVPDVGQLIGHAVRLTRPGGALVLSTLNRTAKAFMSAIIGAEYALRLLPRGTHRYDRFVKPAELARALAAAGARLNVVQGVRYLPFSGTWKMSRDKSVNYLAFAVKPPGRG